jgi:hypothetical protein
VRRIGKKQTGLCLAKVNLLGIAFRAKAYHGGGNGVHTAASARVAHFEAAGTFELTVNRLGILADWRDTELRQRRHLAGGVGV